MTKIKLWKKLKNPNVTKLKLSQNSKTQIATMQFVICNLYHEVCILQHIITRPCVWARDLKFWDNVYHPLCVRCRMSCVTCCVSHVTCHFFLQSGDASCLTIKRLSTTGPTKPSFPCETNSLQLFSLQIVSL